MSGFKKTPRASVFYEHDDAPAPGGWGRDSSSVYGDTITSTFIDNFDNSPRISSKPIRNLGGFERVERGKPPRAFYELSNRYGEKRTTYGSTVPIPLAGNNNTWVPPAVRRRWWNRISKRALWMFGGTFVCLVVLGAIIGGVVAGTNEENVRSGSSPTTTAASILVSQTSEASTITLPNGSIIRTTHVITLTHTSGSQIKTTSQVSTSGTPTKTSNVSLSSSGSSSSLSSSSSSAATPTPTSTTTATTSTELSSGVTSTIEPSKVSSTLSMDSTSTTLPTAP